MTENEKQMIDKLCDAGMTKETAFEWLEEILNEALREKFRVIETHNGTPVTSENLRYAATHEALSRSWIFDVLMGLADILDEKEISDK